MSYVLATTEEKVRWYKYDLKPLKANEIGEYERSLPHRQLRRTLQG